MADEIIISDETDVLTLIDVHLDNEEISVIPLGPPGIIPPVAAFNTVALLSQKIVTQGPDLVIDRALGEHVTLILQNNITSFTILNWPSPYYLGTLRLDIFNQGSFDIETWPSGCVASNGTPPQLTPTGNDLVILTTADGGMSIKVSTVDQNYSPLSLGRKSK